MVLPAETVARWARDHHEELLAEYRRREAARIEDEAGRCRESLKTFYRGCWDVVEPAMPLEWGWHLDAICEHLEAVTRGEIQKLAIFIPPGHAKSKSVAVIWPAWIWAVNPLWRSLYASYAADLAIRDSVDCRALIQSDWYEERFGAGFRLTTDQNVKSHFKNDRGGFRASFGIGGKTTGFRGDMTVVDDAHNVLEAESEKSRKRAIRWFRKSYSSRLNDKRVGRQVVIGQRVHEEDIGGYIESLGRKWEILRLPTEFDPARRSVTSIGWRDPRTERGELLFPTLFPPEVVEEIKEELGSRAYAAQHDQRPAPAEGALWLRKWWRYYDALPEKIDAWVQSWDATFEDGESSDFVVGQLWARAGADCYLVDQVRGRWSFTATLAKMRALAGHEQWGRARQTLVELAANGQAIVDVLARELSGVTGVKVGKRGKSARAAAVSPMIEAGQVRLPRGAPWLEDFVDECTMFPHGKNDDQVDATSQALERLRKRRRRGIYVGS